jgi:tetratricopeptide (TPR) repeat protein
MFKYCFTLLISAAITFSSAAQTTAKDWYDKGTALKKDKKYTEAITAFKKAVSLASSYSEALHQLGWCYNEKGMYNEAIDVLKKESIAGAVDKAENYFEMGYAYGQLLKYDEAISYFTKAIGEDDKYALAYKERGTMYYKNKEYSKVLADFNLYETNVEGEIEDADYYFHKGWVLNDDEKYSDAVTALKKSVELDNTYATACAELGFAYYKLQLNDDAISSYRMATAADVNDAQGVLGIGDVFYYNLKNNDSAMVYYKKGTLAKTNKKKACYKLGWLYNETEKYADAIAPLKDAILQDADYLNARNELGYAYYKLDKTDEALAQFGVVMKQDNKDELSRYYSGFCYYLKNDQTNLKKMISELKALNSTEYVETLNKYVK